MNRILLFLLLIAVIVLIVHDTTAHKSTKSQSNPRTSSTSRLSSLPRTVALRKTKSSKSSRSSGSFKSSSSSSLSKSSKFSGLSKTSGTSNNKKSPFKRKTRIKSESSSSNGPTAAKPDSKHFDSIGSRDSGLTKTNTNPLIHEPIHNSHDSKPPKRRFGMIPKRCSSISDCRGRSGYSGRCSAGYCSCSSGYHRTSLGCLPYTVGQHSIENPGSFGKQCSMDSICRSIFHDDGLTGICLNGRCACRVGYRPALTGFEGCEKLSGGLGRPNTVGDKSHQLNDSKRKGYFCYNHDNCPLHDGYTGYCSSLGDCECADDYLKRQGRCLRNVTASLSVTFPEIALLLVIATYVVKIFGAA